jgi:AcrR family transcriptional regulator
MAARQTRKEKQAATRTLLMKAAAKVCAKRGLQQASIDEVAEEAGYTKGAFYANFASKEELFLAMLDERFGEELERIEQALRADRPPDEAARAAGESFMSFMRSDPEWERLYLEFVGYAARDDEFRQELLTRLRAMDARLAEIYRRWTEEIGITPPIPIEEITLMTSIMADGFLLRQQLDPALGGELYGKMLATFMLGLKERARSGEAQTAQA